ncbi:hypothetical protein ACFQV8_40390 [Pseudonocardia benzenivorans]
MTDQSARSIYGVVLGPSGSGVDAAATEVLRAQMRDRRRELAMKG